MAEHRESRSILVVEHDQSIGEMIKELLTDEGYRVQLVVWPLREAVAEIPDLIIFDVPQLELDGDTEYLADLCRERVVPVILVSSDHRLFDRAPRNCRVVAALEKPFQLEDLLSAVKRSLD